MYPTKFPVHVLNRKHLAGLRHTDEGRQHLSQAQGAHGKISLGGRAKFRVL